MKRLWRSFCWRIVAVSVTLAVVSSSTMAAGQPKPWRNKVDSSLALLYSIQKQSGAKPSKHAPGLSDDLGVEAAIISRHSLSSSQLAELAKLGVHPKRPAHLPGGGSAKIPWAAIEKLAAMEFVDYVGSVWHPSVLSCLDISAEETGAQTVWSMLTDANIPVPITGAGVTVAAFDTGVDVFHPGFWRANGQTYSWIDVNGNGLFDPGIDCVDLNGNGVAESTERLNYIKGSAKDYKGVVTNGSGPFLPREDWLYNDANGNGVRDFGLVFGEASPTYGERIFVVNDSNANGQLDVGESITALKTCKIAATLGSGGITRTRGVDLIYTSADTSGHGTSVCGIICGETPFKRRFTGLAPGVDMIVANRYANDYTTYIPWAEQRGARVMLYEFGGWTFQFLDGTSPLEQMMNAQAAKGIVQVAPSGNLANVKKHAVVDVDVGQSREITLNVPNGRGITGVYLSIIWTRNTENMTFKITNPGGYTYDLLGDMQFRSDVYANSYWSNGPLQSPRGTRRLDVHVMKAAGVTTGDWKIAIRNDSATTVKFDGYVADNLGVWSGGACFKSHISTATTTTWPATADSTLVAGSYSTRGISVPDGALSLYSGAGPRMTIGDLTVDLCAPGNSDVFAPASKDAGNPLGSYCAFGGTSSAAAHAAAAAALALQVNPTLTPSDIATLINETALKDSFTGEVPNQAWGFGKLNLVPVAENAASPALHAIKRIRDWNQDGCEVRLWGKIVVALGNDGEPYCYIEDFRRTSGIKVVGDISQLSEGDKVEVIGIIETVDGERRINASSIRVIAQSYKLLDPLGMNAAALGGTGTLLSPGPWDGIGVNNVGLLVTTWGRVSAIGEGRFYLNSGGVDVAVIGCGPNLPAPGSFISVIGVSSLEARDGQLQRLLRLRRQSDITVFD